MIELSVKMVNSLKPLTIFMKSSIIDVWVGSKSVSDWIDGLVILNISESNVSRAVYHGYPTIRYTFGQVTY